MQALGLKELSEKKTVRIQEEINNNPKTLVRDQSLLMAMDRRRKIPSQAYMDLQSAGTELLKA